MADDDELNLDDNGVGSSAPTKKGGFSGIIPTILKWAIIAIAAITVIVVVSFITVRITTKGDSKQGFNPASITEEDAGPREYYDWYKSIGTIQTFTSDTPPATVRVNVLLGYKKEDKECSQEITNTSVEIKEFLRLYFRSKSASELKIAENENKFKIEIKNGINDTILSKSKIRSISFDQLDVVEQN